MMPKPEKTFVQKYLEELYSSPLDQLGHIALAGIPSCLVAWPIGGGAGFAVGLILAFIIVGVRELWFQRDDLKPFGSPDGFLGLGNGKWADMTFYFPAALAGPAVGAWAI